LQRLSSLSAPAPERRKVLRLAKIDTVAALNVAFFVNAAMLVVAGAVFFQHVNPADLDLQTAYITLIPALGTMAAIAFGIGLLASGLSSSTTGTLAGQVVLQGFLGKHVNMWIWRLITMLPALLVIALNISSVQVLVISQVVLSLQLPFTMLPVLLLTRRQDLMGELVNTRNTNIMNAIILLVVTILNIILLYTLFWG
jgi:manganese transport protein